MLVHPQQSMGRSQGTLTTACFAYLDGECPMQLCLARVSRRLINDSNESGENHRGFSAWSKYEYSDRVFYLELLSLVRLR